jgi:hypothetical protein
MGQAEVELPHSKEGKPVMRRATIGVHAWQAPVVSGGGEFGASKETVV